ncbi:hypothetical protein GN316_19365 [Xylophilus sp. Kf1]|nr:hypothetical protein [Xylophilus sp. Kf1]
MGKTADRKPGSHPVELARVCNLSALPASDLDAVFAATALKQAFRPSDRHPPREAKKNGRSWSGPTCAFDP